MKFKRWIMLAGLAMTLTANVSFAAIDQAASASPPPTQLAQAAPPVTNQPVSLPVKPVANADTWRKINSNEGGLATLPAREAGILIQHEGNAWRQLRNGPVTLYGGLLLLCVVAAIALFYKVRGPIKLSEPRTGRLLPRFTYVERAVHWTVAGTFVLLALTGLLILFGKHVVLPVLGHTVNGYLLIVAKNVHNFVGPVFSIALLIEIAIFLRDNMPTMRDWLWIKRGGGLFSGEHVPSGRFNAGEKIVFWTGVVFLGIVVVATGYVLDFPNLNQLRSTMQVANVIHAVGALFFTAMICGHAYIGSIGMEGALDAMKTGYVDEAWAKEHHEDWYHEVKSTTKSA